MFQAIPCFQLSDVFDVNRIEDKPFLASVGIDTATYGKYILLKYKKDFIKMDPNIGLIRSLIYDTETQHIVSYSPPKSLSCELLQHMNDVPLDNSIRVEEYIEGTMINVFYDNKEKQWNISTRSVIGANTKFFNHTYSHNNSQEDYNINSKFIHSTFKDMFYDGLKENNLELEDLNKTLSYSFVIQHPFNKIVKHIEKPQLYLCSVYRCNNMSVCEIPLYRVDSNCTSIQVNPIISDMFANTTVRIPHINIKCKTLTECIHEYASQTTHFHTQGIVFKVNNNRYKVRNPNNTYVRELRGNQSKIQYHYYELRKANRIKEFLCYFPEYIQLFKTIENEIQMFAQTLYYLYHVCYRFKQKELNDCPYELRNHIWELHKYYLQHLRPKRHGIQYKNAMKYISSLEPARLMFSINYNKRQEKPIQVE